jgi:peptidoglycan/xylan/chitin deacetylase (PgdA/CDA1 family)
MLLLSLPILLVSLAAPAPATAAPPKPDPTSVTTRLDGPWPPSSVLAAEPGGLAPAATAVANTCPAAPYGIHSSAPGTGRTVALTFDDGPGVTTPQILSILQERGLPATFFNIGVNEAVRPAWVRNEQTAGYALGNHTWDHPEMPTLTASQQAVEMDRESAQSASLVGRAPCLFRPPYGEYDTNTLTLAQARGMTVWNWNVDTEDWKAGTATDQSWVDRIISRAQAGASLSHPVILMHNPPAGIPATVAALPVIIKFYADRGYTFVDLYGRPGQRPAPGDARTAGGEQLTYRSADGALHLRTGNGGWTADESLGGDIVGGPATIAQSSTLMSSFVTGSDNVVRQRTHPDAGGGTWIDLGGAATSKPAAAVSPNGSVQVAIRGGNGAIYLRGYQPGSGWGGWQSLGGYLTSAPAVAITADGRLTVVAVGGDRALWLRQRSGSSWGAWQRIGGATNAEPALTASSDGSRLVAVVRGTDGAAWLTVAGSAATSWSPWQTRGGALSSGPAVAKSGSSLVIAAYGTNGTIYRNVATGGSNATGWGGWTPVPAA